MATENKRMRQLQATDAEWGQVNPVLLDGEIAFSSDIRKFKVGPGTWASLPYWDETITSFLRLSDTPPDYAGAAGKLLFVNQSETGIEFVSGTGAWVAKSGDTMTGPLIMDFPVTEEAAMIVEGGTAFALDSRRDGDMWWDMSNADGSLLHGRIGYKNSEQALRLRSYGPGGDTDIANSLYVGRDDVWITGTFTEVPSFNSIITAERGDNRYTRWVGPWVSGTSYEKNQQVRSGSYLAIANQTTTENPAPVPIGDPAYIYTGTNPTTAITAKTLEVVTEYTFLEALALSRYRVYTVTGNAYSVQYKLDDGPVVQVRSFTATSTGWDEFVSSEAIIPAGAKLAISLLMQEPDPSPVVVTANYDYQTPQNTITPLEGQITHARGQADVMQINNIDNDGTDRTAMLQALTPGDIIDSGGLRWAIQKVTSVPLATEFVVAPATVDTIGVKTFSFETTAATPITTLVDPDFYLTAPNVTSAFAVDGGDPVYTDDAYAVDIELQRVEISAHWDLQAVSGNGVTGGEGGGGASSFLQLNDTPTEYTGNADRVLAVNFGETGVEYLKTDLKNPTGGFESFGSATFTDIWGGVPNHGAYVARKSGSTGTSFVAFNTNGDAMTLGFTGGRQISFGVGEGIDGQANTIALLSDVVALNDSRDIVTRARGDTRYLRFDAGGAVLGPLTWDTSERVFDFDTWDMKNAHIYAGTSDFNKPPNSNNVVGGAFRRTEDIGAILLAERNRNNVNTGRWYSRVQTGVDEFTDWDYLISSNLGGTIFQPLTLNQTDGLTPAMVVEGGTAFLSENRRDGDMWLNFKNAAADQLFGRMGWDIDPGAIRLRVYEDDTSETIANSLYVGRDDVWITGTGTEVPDPNSIITAERGDVRYGGGVSRSNIGWLNNIDGAINRFMKSKQGAGGGNVVQDFCVDPFRGELYTLHVTATDPETSVINQYDSDGPRTGTSTRFTPTSTNLVGHQGLTICWDAAGVRWFFAAGRKDRGTYNQEVQLFQIENGTGTDLDITNAATLTLIASGDPDLGTGSITTAASLCGRYLVTTHTNDSKVGTVLVFDMPALLAGGAGDYSGQELIRFQTDRIYVGDDNPLQGVACDGQYIYLFAGDADLANPNTVDVYTMGGDKVHEIADFQIGRAEALGDGAGTDYEMEGADWVWHGGEPYLGVLVASGDTGARTNRVWALGAHKPVQGYGWGDEPAYMSTGTNDFGAADGEALNFGRYSATNDTWDQWLKIDGDQFQIDKHRVEHRAWDGIHTFYRPPISGSGDQYADWGNDDHSLIWGRFGWDESEKAVRLRTYTGGDLGTTGVSLFLYDDLEAYLHGRMNIRTPDADKNPTIFLEQNNGNRAASFYWDRGIEIPAILTFLPDGTQDRSYRFPHSAYADSTDGNVVLRRDDMDARYLQLTGGSIAGNLTMTGTLTMNRTGGTFFNLNRSGDQYFDHKSDGGTTRYARWGWFNGSKSWRARAEDAAGTTTVSYIEVRQDGDVRMDASNSSAPHDTSVISRLRGDNRFARKNSGTFDVTARDSTDPAGGNASPTLGTGTFVRNGDMMFIEFTLTNLDTTGMTGANNLYLHFEETSSTGRFSTAAVGRAYLNCVTSYFTAATDALQLVPDIGGGYISFREIISGGVNIIANVNQFASGTADIYISGSYRV